MSFTRKPTGATKTSSKPPVQRSEAKGSGTAATAKPPPRTVTHEQIAQRAYEIYAGRGYGPGNPDDDWFEAQRQLTGTI